MKINELMTPGLESISPKTTAKEAARKMHDLHIGSLPVVDDGELVGIITDRDICCRVTGMGRDAVMTSVADVMGKEVVTCFDDQDVTDAVRLMVDHHIRRLAVLKRDNSMVGFLSVDDLARNSHELASNVLQATTQVH